MSAQQPGLPGWYPDPDRPQQLRWWDGQQWGARRPHDPSKPASSMPTANIVNPRATGDSGSIVHRGHPSAAGQPTVANPVLRLLARLLDGFVTQVLTMLLVSGAWTVLNDKVAQPGTLQPERTEQLFADATFVSAYLTVMGVFAAVSAVYFIVTTWWWGGTLGKLVCGLRVRRDRVDGRVSWWRAAVRWFATDVPWAAVLFALVTTQPWATVAAFGTLGLMLYWVVDRVSCLLNPRRWCVHDRVAGTVVVRASSLSAATDGVQTTQRAD